MGKNVVFGYGNIGKLIVSELKARGQEVVVASHRPLNDNLFDSTVVNSLDQAEVTNACKGADQVYMTIGLEYKLKVWKRDWPVIIENLIAAAKETGAKIVFFDNIYLYGPSPLQNPITELHPRQAPSKKGQIRLELVNKLEAAMQDGVKVLIARSADFYGPNVTTSAVTMAINDMSKGKKAYYLGDPKKLHSFTYVPDAAKAVVDLALADDTYNQTWHLPTAPAIAGEQLMGIITNQLGKSNWLPMGRVQMSLVRIFVPILRELYEMMYQFENDYVLSDAKFMQRFPDFNRTEYKDGIAATIKA